MFTGNLLYITHERKKGISQKSGNEYDFANITLSNGLISFTVDMKPSLNELPLLDDLRLGDKVVVTLNYESRYGKDEEIVTDVKKG